jgi:hypothetical protein
MANASARDRIQRSSMFVGLRCLDRYHDRDLQGYILEVGFPGIPPPDCSHQGSYMPGNSGTIRASAAVHCSGGGGADGQVHSCTTPRHIPAASCHRHHSSMPTMATAASAVPFSWGDPGHGSGTGVVTEPIIIVSRHRCPGGGAPGTLPCSHPCALFPPRKCTKQPSGATPHTTQRPPVPPWLRVCAMLPPGGSPLCCLHKHAPLPLGEQVAMVLVV